MQGSSQMLAQLNENFAQHNDAVVIDLAAIREQRKVAKQTTLAKTKVDKELIQILGNLQKLVASGKIKFGN